MCLFYIIDSNHIIAYLHFRIWIFLINNEKTLIDIVNIDKV